jgi:hypothetical protein
MSLDMGFVIAVYFNETKMHVAPFRAERQRG